MHLIFGGAYQGKLEYAEKTFGAKNMFECDDQQPKLDFSGDGIFKLECFVLACLREGIEAKDYLIEYREALAGKIIICTDQSQGIVPMEEELRQWREMTGRTMLYLTREAETVTRVFCGLSQRLKG